MAYITRDDGVQFVVPSYRDVLTMKSEKALKKEILALSNNYGKYITMQQKSTSQYEVAFSPDTGYVLGETVWNYFKRPMDMVYCEAVPNTSEAILVIVVSGGVYLDGRFQMDSIPDELVVFLTQKNSFDIFVHGDVPISQTPEEDKFSFEPESVRSFNILDESVFQDLPLVRSYQLRLVGTVLKENKIGVFPVKKAVIGAIIATALYFMWGYITAPSTQQAIKSSFTEENPYIEFNRLMTSNDPVDEMMQAIDKLSVLLSLPGWQFVDANVNGDNFIARVTSNGSNVAFLKTWASQNSFVVSFDKSNFSVGTTIPTVKRPTPEKIYPLDDTIATIIDRLMVVFPGNNIRFTNITRKGVFQSVDFDIEADKVSLATLRMIVKEMHDLPLILASITFQREPDGMLSAKFSLKAMGN